MNPLDPLDAAIALFVITGVAAALGYGLSCFTAPRPRRTPRTLYGPGDAAAMKGRRK